MHIERHTHHSQRNTYIHRGRRRFFNIKANHYMVCFCSSKICFSILSCFPRSFRPILFIMSAWHCMAREIFNQSVLLVTLRVFPVFQYYRLQQNLFSSVLRANHGFWSQTLCDIEKAEAEADLHITCRPVYALVWVSLSSLKLASSTGLYTFEGRGMSYVSLNALGIFWSVG